MNKGYFIVLEGPDGSGKSSVSDIVCEKLTEKGYEVVHTREPGGIEIAEEIRNIILDPKNTSMDAKTEALLYAASRRQHLVEKVVPAKSQGKIVICERFVYSSLAYQGYGRGLGFDEILKINDFAIGSDYPDMTIYLDINEEVGLKRIESRTFKDRLDKESLSFHHLVNEGYREVLRRFKDTKVVDASKSIDCVVDDVLALIIDLIND
ncbi:MAG: dTMP kinase [Erysipelotrichaceae bacterium]|nr:dTMP kinase [Erysipelotrichaceae bacterium]